MNNLKKLCLVLSAGSIAALSLSACSDDPAETGGTAGTSTGGTASAGTSSGGTGTAGTGTAGTGTAGTGTAGTGTAGTGTAGTATGGTGGSGGAGGSGGKGGAGGTGGSGGAGGSGGKGGAGGSGGSGGASGPMCADTEDPATTKAATCNDFCTDWDAKCKAIDAAKYADKAACMADCATFTVAALCCRAYHVNNTPASDHCPHAKGMGPCAGK